MNEEEQIIPVVNCPDFGCVSEKFRQVGELGCSWVHIDISDGEFTPVKTWNEPKDLIFGFNIEVHLMVLRPEEIIGEWLRVGVKRLVVHLESFRGREEKLNFIFEQCAERNVEVMIAINPKTPVDELVPFFDGLFFIQILAVSPGPSGQKFDESVIEKIRFLRERAPDVTIEVDGGINLETARLVFEAGADIIASGSYIFESKNPRKAFQDLKAILNPVL